MRGNIVVRFLCVCQTASLFGAIRRGIPGMSGKADAGKAIVSDIV